MNEFLSWDTLTRVPFQDEVTGPFMLGVLIAMVAGFVISAGLYLRPPAAIRNHEIRRWATLRHSNWFMWAFGVGLVFYAFQVMGLPFIGIRLWTWITILGVLVVAVLTAIYFVRVYPAQMAAHEAKEAKRVYLRQTRKRPTTPDGQAQPRSSRAEKRRQRAGSGR